jgi:mannose-6-phosphate isomerase
LLEDGTPLSDVVTEKDLGKNCKGFDCFPVLVKFIDAQDKLSVQVHPSDEYALKHENSLGKTEMWYIVDADEGAGIYLGFKESTTKEEFANAISNGTLCSLLNFINVKPGECYFIPAGTIHAIGSGCIICEIQQNSNVTYRVFDYKRKDKDGNERELHIDNALAVTDLNKFTPESIEPPLLAKCKYFTVTRLDLCGETTQKTVGKSFHSLTCILGNATINGEKMTAGDTFFVPANFGEYSLCGNAEILICST